MNTQKMAEKALKHYGAWSPMSSAPRNKKVLILHTDDTISYCEVWTDIGCKGWLYRAPARKVSK